MFITVSFNNICIFKCYLISLTAWMGNSNFNHLSWFKLLIAPVIMTNYGQWKWFCNIIIKYDSLFILKIKTFCILVYILSSNNRRPTDVVLSLLFTFSLVVLVLGQKNRRNLKILFDVSLRIKSPQTFDKSWILLNIYL